MVTPKFSDISAKNTINGNLPVEGKGQSLGYKPMYTVARDYGHA